MTKAQRELAFWNKLLSCADELQQEGKGLAACHEQLQTIVEAFDKQYDPVEHYEAYVALQLIKEIAIKMNASLAK